MATSLLIVQHGEKERTSGDPGLTRVGRQQASAIAASLARGRRPSALYSSPMRRAIETAAPIAERLSLSTIIDDRLRERMNWGDARSQSLASFLAEWSRASADRDLVPCSGDSSREAGRRFREAIDEFASRHSGATVVVVAHGGVTVDLLRTLTGDTALEQAAPRLIDDGVPFGAVTRLEARQGGWHVLRLAGTEHLEAAFGHEPG